MAHAQTISGTGVEMNGRSPINRHSLRYDEIVGLKPIDVAGQKTPVMPFIAENDRAAGVAVYGNADAGRSEMALAVAEQAIAMGEPIISLTTIQSSFGLAKLRSGGAFGPRPWVVLGRGLGTPDIEAVDGKNLPRLVMDQRVNLACDVGHILSNGRIGTFLTGLASYILDNVRGPLALHLDIVQAMVLRRRDGGSFDSAAVKAIAQLAELAYYKKIRLIATASSPTEIPIELRNGLKTRIMVRATDDIQVNGINTIVQSETSIQAERRQKHGLMMLADGQGWISPGANALEDHIAYLPIPDLVSEAGPNGELPDNLDKGTVKKFTDAMMKERPKKGKNKGRGGRNTRASNQAGAVTACVAHDADKTGECRKQAPRFGNPRDGVNAMSEVQRRGLPNQTVLVAGTRVLISLDRAKRIDYSLSIGGQEILQRIGLTRDHSIDPTLDAAAKWTMSNVHRLKGLIGNALAFSLHVECDGDGKLIVAALDRAKDILSQMNVEDHPLTSESRREVMLSAIDEIRQETGLRTAA